MTKPEKKRVCVEIQAVKLTQFHSVVEEII